MHLFGFIIRICQLDVRYSCQNHIHYKFIPVLICTVELGYDVMKGTEYFVTLQRSVVQTEKHNIMVESEEFTGATEHLYIRGVA